MYSGKAIKTEEGMKKIKISVEELQSAIQKFLKEGGIIQKLPEQKSRSLRMVGGKWNNSEIGGELTH